MNFLPVFLLSDKIIWLLVVAALWLFVVSRRTPSLKASWRRIGQSRKAVAAITVLFFFVLIGLVDSMHYRPTLPNAAKNAPPVYAVEVLSALDALAAPLRWRLEKTYSEPLATHAYAKETMEITDANGNVVQTRDFPRLTYGGMHLGNKPSLTERIADVWKKLFTAEAFALLLWLTVAIGLVFILAWQQRCSWAQAVKKILRPQDSFAWDALLVSLALILLIAAPIFALCGDYHVFGTDKVGQDVLYQVLKSIRTALVIGLVTTLVTLPLAIFFGILAGYFRGWVDDLIQYIYTTISSIPSVLLITAAVLMMQVVIDTHPEWFATVAERADARLLALCFILGLTSWTSVCRLLRGETLKLRELEYIQAAEAFGVSNLRILLRHVLPNLMPLIIISLVMDFSGLVLAEAVLSYVGIGVDSSMISFGTMINNARMELAREPMVWWSLAAAFGFMFTLVLAANLLADSVRDAFDPRMTMSQ